MENGRIKKGSSTYSIENKRIWVAGHNGMVGSSLCRILQKENCRLLTVSKKDMDLRDQPSVRSWIESKRPDIIILAAAKVGGIMANSKYPAEFIYDNLTIATNVIDSAYKSGVERLLYLGSSCIYPRESMQPIKEEYLLSAPLEPTNEAYAIAKIAGVKMVQAYADQYGCDYICAMPCNLYGRGDHYDKQNSHVIPAMIMKMHEAKLKQAGSIKIWGTGRAYREFMYVDDLADALLFLLKNYHGRTPVNIGSGHEISIAKLANKIAKCVGFKGNVKFDSTMPDGTIHKLMDSSRLYALGWRPLVNLEQGLEYTYGDFLQRSANGIAA